MKRFIRDILRLCVSVLLASPAGSCFADEPAAKTVAVKIVAPKTIAVQAATLDVAIENPVKSQEKPVAGIDIRARDAQRMGVEKPVKGEDNLGKEKKKKGKEKPEAPSGYEDAPEAGEAPRAAAEGGIGRARAMRVAPKRENPKVEKEDPNEDILKKKVDANVLKMEKQYLPRFQRLAKVERSFILRACQLDKKQQSRIAKASDRCAKVAARRFAIAQNSLRVGRGLNVVRLGGAARLNTNATQSDPREQVGRELLLSVNELLSPEQKKGYAEESKKRKDHLKQITILNLVVVMDRRLVLTALQREQLTESLTKNWNPSWIGALQYLINNNEYLPRIHNKHVVKFLNDKQKVLWQGIQKVSFSPLNNIWIRSNGKVIEDDFAVEEEEADVNKDAAQKEAVKFDKTERVDIVDKDVVDKKAE